MTNFLRSLLPSTALRSASARLALFGVALAALLAFAAPAGALITEAGPVKVGLQPREESSVFDGPFWADPSEPETFENVKGAGPVIEGSNVYLIYWDPASKYHGDWQQLINGFVKGLEAESGSRERVFSVDAQYTDAEGAAAKYKIAYRGSYTDPYPYPTVGNCTDPHKLTPEPVHGIAPLTCLTDAQIQAELKRFIAEHKLPTGLHTVFYMLTPPGATVCLSESETPGRCSDFKATLAEEKQETPLLTNESYLASFCSYHSSYETAPKPSEKTVLYGVIPWTAGGLADGQLYFEDEKRTGISCQDGGFDPSSNPIEQKEKVKEESAAEKEAFTKANGEEKAKIEHAHELEGPHQEEPNQPKCPSADGFCDTGLADLIVGQLATEQQNIITDPFLNAWHDSLGNEATDECRNFYAPTDFGSVSANEDTAAGTLGNQQFGANHYYINDAFNLAALRLNYPGVPCINAVNLTPSFTAPSKVNANETVGFNGMESEITLNAGYTFRENPEKEEVRAGKYATFTWDFNDGSGKEAGNEEQVSGQAPGAPKCLSEEGKTQKEEEENPEWERPPHTPCAASVFHRFKYNGTYNVTLVVTDIAGNSEETSSQVTVTGGENPPSTETSKGTESTTGKGGSAGAVATTTPAVTTTPPAPAVVAVPAPNATATVLSRTLRLAASKGLAVRYSVNEQVAGRFEVLLASSVAHHLGISGPLASGLPAGSAPQRVIARAVLVTTRGGSSTIHIIFSRATAARLVRAHSASLGLRMVVRNASAGSAATTVITRATLTR